MHRFYTRVCNFYYGDRSKSLVKKKETLPLNGNKELSFDQIQIISRKYKKRISIKELNKLPKLIKKQVTVDLKKITSKKKKFFKSKF